MNNIDQQIPPVPNQTPAKIANNLSFAKTLAYGFAIASVGVAIAIGGYLLGANKTKPQPISQAMVTQTTAPDPTANWKTYSYKNISFKYPTDWIVIFDSGVFGQPNGFVLHAQNENATVYQPDGLYLSTFNDRDSQTGNEAYVLSPARKFNKKSEDGSYIQFDINANRFYAGCASSILGQQTFDICNQILSTFKFTN